MVGPDPEAGAIQGEVAAEGVDAAACTAELRCEWEGLKLLMLLRDVLLLLLLLLIMIQHQLGHDLLLLQLMMMMMMMQHQIGYA